MSADLAHLPSCVRTCIGRRLHRCRDHPVAIVKDLVCAHLQAIRPFTVFEDLPPAVSVEDNFDKLLIPPGHPARSADDTFYLPCGRRVLRTHTSAHQHALLTAGHRNFCVVGDVYRRDTVDRTHFPVFHQLEGVCEVPPGEDPAAYLTTTMRGLVHHLFPGCDHRVTADYFPFTEPSFEIEVLHDRGWLEVLGCGVVHHRIMQDVGVPGRLVAWGLGLERLAMILFRIPDIRLFWTHDTRFTSQFKQGHLNRFAPYSLVPPVDRDISFWLPAADVDGDGGWRHGNLFHELVRDHSDSVQTVSLTDTFTHPRTGRRSHTFTLHFAPLAAVRDGAELAAHANDAIGTIGRTASDRLGIDLR